MAAKKPPRHRRSAAEARELILDAAQKRIEEGGPASIRLQEVAADVGVSHPAILHHFGSREGLLHAVVERAIGQLQGDLVATLVAGQGAGPDGGDLFERVSDTLGRGGHARLMAWLLLSGYDPLDSDATRTGWATIAEATHALRVAGTKGKTAPPFQDTRFTIMLSALALFGQAIAGSATFRAAGLGDGPRAEKAFRKWLGELLAKHLEGGV